jgi:hypothetical protein
MLLGRDTRDCPRSQRRCARRPEFRIAFAKCANLAGIPRLLVLPPRSTGCSRRAARSDVRSTPESRGGRVGQDRKSANFTPTTRSANPCFSRRDKALLLLIRLDWQRRVLAGLPLRQPILPCGRIVRPFLAGDAPGRRRQIEVRAGTLCWGQAARQRCLGTVDQRLGAGGESSPQPRSAVSGPYDDLRPRAIEGACFHVVETSGEARDLLACAGREDSDRAGTKRRYE